jgi:putative sugar O-methyltransferase
MNSISDSTDYKEFCKIASNNQEVFNTFKVNPIYNGILEHVSFEQGLIYLQYLNKNYPDFLNIIDKFKKNDLFGSPIMYNYEGVGVISPTTLRYIKVLCDLKNIFGDLNGKKIIEIGVGYGGQSFILNQMFNLEDYTLVDLDDVLSLSSKYLTNHNISHRTLKIEDLNKLDEEFDLVISNYAYSEVSRELQDLYYDKIIKKSKNGYFTFNFISEMFGIDSYNYGDILNKFSEKKIKIMNEYPETFENNKILYFVQRESYSQVEQDLWVLDMLNNKKNGYFLDIGAFDGVKCSNTFILEKNYNWKGLLIEAQPETFSLLQKTRTNQCLNYAITDKTGEVKFDNFSYTGSKISNDGITVNSITFSDLFRLYNVPKVIDYMSLDIEGNEYTSLLKFPFSEYVCNLITVEHNLYIDGPENKNKLNNLLTSNGYVLYKENVMCDNNPFEDWYVHSSFLQMKSSQQKLMFNIGGYHELFTEQSKKICSESKIVLIEDNEDSWRNLHLRYESDKTIIPLHYLVSDKTDNFISYINTTKVNLNSLITIFGNPDLVRINTDSHFEVISGLSEKIGEICFRYKDENYEQINSTCLRLKDLGYTNFGYIIGDEYLKPEFFTTWESSEIHKHIKSGETQKRGFIWVN